MGKVLKQKMGLGTVRNGQPTLALQPVDLDDWLSVTEMLKVVREVNYDPKLHRQAYIHFIKHLKSCADMIEAALTVRNLLRRIDFSIEKTDVFIADILLQFIDDEAALHNIIALLHGRGYKAAESIYKSGPYKKLHKAHPLFMRFIIAMESQSDDAKTAKASLERYFETRDIADLDALIECVITGDFCFTDAEINEDLLVVSPEIFESVAFDFEKINFFTTLFSKLRQGHEIEKKLKTPHYFFVRFLIATETRKKIKVPHNICETLNKLGLEKSAYLTFLMTRGDRQNYKSMPDWSGSNIQIKLPTANEQTICIVPMNPETLSEKHERYLKNHPLTCISPFPLSAETVDQSPARFVFAQENYWYSQEGRKIFKQLHKKVEKSVERLTRKNAHMSRLKQAWTLYFLDTHYMNYFCFYHLQKQISRRTKHVVVMSEDVNFVQMVAAFLSQRYPRVQMVCPQYKAPKSLKKDKAEARSKQSMHGVLRRFLKNKFGNGLSNRAKIYRPLSHEVIERLHEQDGFHRSFIDAIDQLELNKTPAPVLVGSVQNPTYRAAAKNLICEALGRGPAIFAAIGKMDKETHDAFMRDVGAVADKNNSDFIYMPHDHIRKSFGSDYALEKSLMTFKRDLHDLRQLKISCAFERFLFAHINFSLFSIMCRIEKYFDMVCRKNAASYALIMGTRGWYAEAINSVLRASGVLTTDTHVFTHADSARQLKPVTDFYAVIDSEQDAFLQTHWSLSAKSTVRIGYLAANDTQDQQDETKTLPASFAKILDGLVGEKNILIATQPSISDQNFQMIYAAIKAAKEHSDLNILIKTHPREDDEARQRYGDYLRQFAPEGRSALLNDDLKIEPVLTRANIVMTRTSNVGLQAAISDVPVVRYVANEAFLPDVFMHLPYALNAQSYDEAVRYLCDLAAQGKLYDGLEASRAQYFSENPGLKDHNACEILIDFMEKNVQNNK